MSSVSDEYNDEDNNHSDVSIGDLINNKDQFQKLLELCRQNKEFPHKYIEDMNKMYKKCTDEQKNEDKLCNLILKGIEHISPSNKNSFRYAANVYNELLQLTQKDSINLKFDNCVAGTSNDTENIDLELENGPSKKMSKSNEIFKEFINKCYANQNFSNTSIEVIDKLYNSLPIEFVDSEFFIRLLKEANVVIWPDSNKSSYVYVKNIHEQLQQFEISMKIQERKISVEDKKINEKKFIKLEKLQNALNKIKEIIKKLDEKEMDINCDHNFELNSPYILKDKYEKRAVEIYKRICSLRDEPDFLVEPPLRFKQTDNDLVNKTIEKYYNISKTFPNYFEIYTLLRLLNEKKKLNWNNTKLKYISQNAFLKLGKQLKIRRLKDYIGRWEFMVTEKDPAEDNPEINRKLEESNTKFHADMDALSKKFLDQQDYAEETEGSDLDKTECEYSSDEEEGYSYKNKNTKELLVKRKRKLSKKLHVDEPQKKSHKTIYMESFNLKSCDTPEKLSNEIDEELCVITDKVPDKRATETISEIEVIQITNNINKENEQIPKKLIENINNSNDNLEINVVEIGLLSDGDDDGDGTLMIDEDICIGDNTDKNKIIEDNILRKEENKNIDIPTNNENSNVTVTELDVNNANENLENDVIEINDSDVEMTSVPLQNKQSLETIIKNKNYDKKYKWDKQSNENSKYSNSIPSNNLGNENIPKHNNLVNRWVMNGVHDVSHRTNNLSTRGNNVRSPRVSNTRFRSNFSPIRYPNNNNNLRPPFIGHRMHRMQSTIQRSTTQTERQVTQRYMNTVQQHRNFMNNQSVLQQRVTTMTTTTTMVRQVVQQSSQPVQRSRIGNFNNQPRSISSQSNGSGKPELIEID